MVKAFKITQCHVLAIAAVLTAIAIAGVMLSPKAHATQITVYKSPTCNCCDLWVRHLESDGFDVTVNNISRTADIKQDLGVPRQLYACHTATMGNYVIEGHVPASDIMTLKAKQPNIEGIGVGGMPMGSPGMDAGPAIEPYNVLAYRGLQTKTFSSH